MSKSVTDIDEYKYEIDEDLKKLAGTELRESFSTIQQSLEAIREWAQQNPRITSIRLDSKFLLCFLRAKKFSIPMAEESIERYLLLREYLHENEFLFKNVNFQQPGLKELIDLGYVFSLPKRDKLGRRVVFYRPGVYDPSKNFNYEILRLHIMTYETLMENEENQIKGLVHIVDADGIGFNYMTIFTPKEAIRIIKNTEKTLPIRHKSISGININPSIKFAVDFGLSIVSEKMKNRIHLHTSIDELIEKENIDPSILPKEYGGDVPMGKMIELWKDEIKDTQKIFELNDKMTVNLNMYSEKAREGAVSALKQNFGCATDGQDTNIYGLQGSFRKLEVD